MNIQHFTENVQVWNFKTNQFDAIGTLFDYDSHVNQSYHLKEQQDLMMAIIEEKKNHYWATVITSCEGETLLTPGFWRINRLGYVIYRANRALNQDQEYSV